MSETERKAALTGVMVGLILAIIPITVLWDVALTRGEQNGRNKERAVYEAAQTDMRKLGFCEWPAAFYKASKCGEHQPKEPTP